MPIHFMHKSVSFDELIALYAVSDVCLVSSTRDGMNLVSYEYIATQQKRHGVMVLSEFTGAAQSLNGSLIVNPWNTEELAGAIHDAVTMGEEQRLLNFQKLDKYVSKYTRSVTITFSAPFDTYADSFMTQRVLGPIIRRRAIKDLRAGGEEEQREARIITGRREWDCDSCQWLLSGLGVFLPTFCSKHRLCKVAGLDTRRWLSGGILCFCNRRAGKAGACMILNETYLLSSLIIKDITRTSISKHRDLYLEQLIHPSKCLISKLETRLPARH